MIHDEKIESEELENISNVNLKRKLAVELQVQPPAKNQKLDDYDNDASTILSSDNQISPTNATNATELLRKQSIDRMYREIKKQKHYLQDKHMTAFINIANNSGRCIQPMAETLLVQREIENEKEWRT